MIDDPGMRNQRVTLYDVPATTTDQYGQEPIDGALIGEFWAYVTNLSGRELLAAQQAFTSVTHRVELGWLGTAIPATTNNPNRLILPGMYLILKLDGSRLDVIDASNEDKGNYKWVLKCNERVKI